MLFQKRFQITGDLTGLSGIGIVDLQNSCVVLAQPRNFLLGRENCTRRGQESSPTVFGNLLSPRGLAMLISGNWPARGFNSSHRPVSFLIGIRQTFSASGFWSAQGCEKDRLAQAGIGTQTCGGRRNPNHGFLTGP